MKINNVGYLLKEGLRGIFSHGFMSFAAVCVTVACLLIVGSFSSLMYNVNIMVEDLNKTNEVMVYVDASLSDAEAKSVGTKINQVDNVYRAKFITRQEALEDFKADHQDDSSFDGVVAEDLRHRFSVTLEDNSKIDETIAALEKVPGVGAGNVKGAQTLAKSFSTLETVVQLISYVIIAVLLVVSLLIISNTVKLAMYDRKDEIAIMKMVGATNGFIRLPYVVEGFSLGMIGAMIAFALEWVFYDSLVMYIVDDLNFTLIPFVPFDELLLPMALVFSGAGLFVGVVGSWTSIRKFLDV